MTITYTWEFPRFSAHPALNGLNNVVYNVEFILTATDGNGHGAQIFDNIGISEPNPDEFRPFNLLTQRVVEGWVEAALDGGRLADYKQNLADQIERQCAPVTVTLNKPW
jgi:hypothetical protein